MAPSGLLLPKLPFMHFNKDNGLWRTILLNFLSGQQIQAGLSEALKDELARVEAPASFEDLIQLAI